MGQLVFQATLGGQVNLVGPNTASTFNLNVPAVSSTIASLAAQTFAGAQTFTLDASISGLTVGKGGGAVTGNTALGVSALSTNTTSDSNTAIGYQAGQVSNGTYGGNSFVGYQSGKASTTAYACSFFGESSGLSNTTGVTNVAIGGSALRNNTTASNNTAVGYQAGYTNATGARNTFIGYLAGYTSAVVSANAYNTFVGAGAGQYTTTGAQNTFIGDTAGQNTTGGLNTFIGQGSGFAITSGTKNSILGMFPGNQGGLDIRTASNYIVLSDGDGNPRAYWQSNGIFTQNASVNNDVSAVIKNADSTAPYGLLISFNGATPNNTTQYFLNCADSTNTKLVISSNGTVSNRTGTYNTISDAKLKENISDATPKLDKLMDVKVRNYNLIGDELKQIGFVAQELETIFPALIDNVPDLDKNKKPTGEVTKGVKLTVMIPILVKAIQELNAKVEAQALEIATLKGQ